MNRADLAAVVADATDLTKAQADAALSAALDGIGAALARGEKVTLPGFGTFEARERAARTGRNPATGESMEIPASTAPAFKAAKGLKDALNA